MIAARGAKTIFQSGIDFTMRVTDPHKLSLAREASQRFYQRTKRKVGSLYLGNRGTRNVTNMFANSDGMRNLDFKHQIRQGYAMIRKVREIADGLSAGEKVYRSLEHVKGYSWLKFLRFTDGEVIPHKMTLPYIATAKGKFAKLLTLVGVDGSGNDQQVSGQRLLSILRKDPTFPREITIDMIINEVAKPDIMGNVEAIFDFFVAIGTLPHIAYEAAEVVIREVARRSFDETAKSYSLNDAVLPSLKLPELSKMSVHVRVDTGRSKVQDFLRELGLAVLVTRGMRFGVWREIEVAAADPYDPEGS